ncbi:hypothetical protein ACNS7O_04690 [Haloferacaceae archaeon DSL9]
MTTWDRHVASAVPVAFLAVALGYHPLVALPLVAGTVLPEIDTVDERMHRSWAFHTFTVPAALYVTAERVDALTPTFAIAVHFLTLGMALHFLADYVYPKTQTHRGAEWPVRPVGVSAPWGLLWFGLVWAFQWFFYLSPAFIPWVVGAA